MSAPRPAQLATLRALITAVAQAEQTTEAEVKVSIGLLERTPWGVRGAGRTLTRGGIAVMIDALRARRTGATP